MNTKNTKQKLKIQWLVNAVDFGKGRISLGFCEKQPKKVAFIAPEGGMATFIPIVVRDLYITAWGCEEQHRCFVLDCPLNRTTFTSYINSAKWKKDGIPRKKNFEILLIRLSEWQSMLKDDIAAIDWIKGLTYVYPQPRIKLTRGALPKKG